MPSSSGCCGEMPVHDCIVSRRSETVHNGGIASYSKNCTRSEKRKSPLRGGEVRGLVWKVPLRFEVGVLHSLWAVGILSIGGCVKDSCRNGECLLPRYRQATSEVLNHMKNGPFTHA